MVKTPQDREKREISLKPPRTNYVEDTSYLIIVTFMYFPIDPPNFIFLYPQYVYMYINLYFL